LYTVDCTIRTGNFQGGTYEPNNRAPSLGQPVRRRIRHHPIYW
jgi:hypothetical protein